MPQEPVHPVNTVNPVTSSLASTPFPPRPDSYPDLPGEGLLVSQMQTREQRPPQPTLALPEPDFDDFTQEREVTWSATSPTSGEKALALIIFAAAIGFVLFILWILSFSTP